jgi:hypothetical protein
MSERDQVLRQIDRLIASPVLHGSESLCKLLRYLAKHALDHPGEPLKEYKIATEEFGRPPDFDAQLDSMVRVQAGRLRGKLAEYYASDGAEDHIRVELPKGTYLLSFQHRSNQAKTGAHITPGREEVHPTEHPIPRGWLAVVVVLSTLLILSGLALYNTRRTIPAGPETKPAAAALQTFWKPFLDRPEEPLIVFSNAAFVGRPETGMRYYNPGQDSRDSIWDHYTGVGEVLAVHNLDQVFASLHRNIRVKRGSLFSLDDAKNNDLIFVGSPSENLTLLEIPGTQEFVFQRVDSGARKGDLAVVNVHPEAGESKEYLASSSTSPLTEDYAVVALLHGLNPSRFVMIVAGTTTFGTQGAIEYVCRQNSIEELLLRLSVSQTGEVQPFEALLRVKVTRGVPVETQLVSLRKIVAR